jgi:hypothetical protein
MVSTISCDEINLDSILGGLLVAWATSRSNS